MGSLPIRTPGLEASTRASIGNGGGLIGSDYINMQVKWKNAGKVEKAGTNWQSASLNQQVVSTHTEDEMVQG